MPDSFLSTTIGNKSVVDKIIDRIVSAIIEGELQPGAKLPTELELCRDLEVGRNSVREAIKKLEAYGVVYIKRAEGTFVSESYNQKMLDPVLYGLILQKNDWNEFVQLRRVMDIGTLNVVIERGLDTEQLDELKDAVNRIQTELNREEPEVNKVLEEDKRFHRLIAEAVGNQQVVDITEYVTRITVPSRRITIRKVLEAKETEHFVDLHRQIVEVIEQRDFARIPEVVTNHYVYWKKE